jgi:hypothetical protein
MIFYHNPFLKSDLGEYYKQACRSLRKGDYCIFTDGDTAFTTNYWGDHIEKTLKENPDINLFTCYTNRNGYMYGGRSQISPFVGVDENYTEEDHREIGQSHIDEFGYDVEPILKPLSGAMIGISYELSKKLKFKSGILGIDNDIHYQAQDLGEECYLFKGTYIWHYYRGGDMANKSHLK